VDFGQLVRQVKPNPGKKVTLQIRRDGALRELPITIGEDASGGRRSGLIGITPVNKPLDSDQTAQDMLTLQKYGPVAALGEAAAKTLDTSLFTLRIVGRILT